MNRKIHWKYLLVITIFLLVVGGFYLFSFFSSNSASYVETRDLQRIEDMQNLKLSLTIYYEQETRYPENLSSLVPLYFVDIPEDPRSGEAHNSTSCAIELETPYFAYRYAQTNEGQGFTLQACLEGGENRVFTVVSYE